MEQTSEYIGLLAAFIISVIIAGLIVFLNHILGPKHKGSRAKSEPFECGIGQISAPSARRFSIKFYLIAMLFILFDVEIVWFFPWAVILKDLKWAGIAEMFAFIFALILGFIYAWKKGALEWER